MISAPRHIMWFLVTISVFTARINEYTAYAQQTTSIPAGDICCRAALLVSTIARPAKPTVSVGRAVWTIIPAPPGDPGNVGVKADIEIPAQKMHASMVLRKNFDPSLPASHTIDLRLTFDPSSSIKGVKDIALPLMRRDDPPAADALLGVRVKINDNYFLIGLNRDEADIRHNVKGLAERTWFDFPMQLDDKRIAKLTFEKGTVGRQKMLSFLSVTDVFKGKIPTKPAPSASPSLAKSDDVPPSSEVRQAKSSGTGFFVSGDGDVITNAHVVEGCSTISIRTSGGENATAYVRARDERNDLTLLKTGVAAKKVAAFRTSIRLGEGVEAFGYPLTFVLSTSGNFTLGNVSALAGIGDDTRYLQMSAPVQPGNSGGGLLDQAGNVVGVVSAKVNALKIMVATNGDIPQNVNFAIKASIVENFLDANSITYTAGSATQAMQPADIADLARAMSVFISCN